MDVIELSNVQGMCVIINVCRAAVGCYFVFSDTTIRWCSNSNIHQGSLVRWPVHIGKACVEYIKQQPHDSVTCRLLPCVMFALCRKNARSQCYWMRHWGTACVDL